MSDERRKIEVETPLGVFRVIGSPLELIRVLFPTDDFSNYESVSLLRPEEDYSVLSDAADTLYRYFRGERISWAGKPIPAGTSFRSRIWELTAEIPFGSTLSYGELAMKAGSPKAARAVGSAMASNPIPILVPCHRVVGSNGALCGFGGGLDVKRWLLEHEGVESP